MIYESWEQEILELKGGLSYVQIIAKNTLGATNESPIAERNYESMN